MTWTFDPRFSIYDNAETLEQHMLAEATEGSHPKPSIQQVEHLTSLAAAKSAGGRKHCSDCALELAIGTAATRCVTCQAKRKVALWREKRRVHKAFVRDVTYKGKPKPGRDADEPVIGL